MSLPDEKYRAVNASYIFLRELSLPGRYGRVPRSVREKARRCLRHFPFGYEIAQMMHHYYGKEDLPWSTIQQERESNTDASALSALPGSSLT